MYIVKWIMYNSFFLHNFQAGVLLLPATVYNHAPSIARGHFRIGFGRKNAIESLEKLEEYLDKL